MMMPRFFGTLGVVVMLASHPHWAVAQDIVRTMIVTKTPNCGCCAAWADIARGEGFEVEVIDSHDYEGTKASHSVPEHLWSCHSAKLGRYVLEGHVPFEAVEKLLKEQPDIVGISVPGMPAGSPGMGDDPTARYDVYSFGGDAGSGEMFYSAGQ